MVLGTSQHIFVYFFYGWGVVEGLEAGVDVNEVLADIVPNKLTLHPPHPFIHLNLSRHVDNLAPRPSTSVIHPSQAFRGEGGSMDQKGSTITSSTHPRLLQKPCLGFELQASCLINPCSKLLQSERQNPSAQTNVFFTKQP